MDQVSNQNQDQEKLRDFRTYLQRTLVMRCKENPQYSLRAFAKSLEIEPSALSKILNGKRSITAKMYERLSQKLDLSGEDYEYYHPKNTHLREKKVEATTLSSDVFNFICDWYHYAILELIRVKGFKNDIAWIARALGITTSQVQDAVDRLTRMKLLIKDDFGRWHDNSGNITTLGHPFSTQAFRHLQKQILSMGIEAMDMIPMEKRDQTSMTFAVNSSKVGQARELIKNFRRDLAEILTSGDKDEVYQMSISLYPITQISEEKRNDFH
ncbi:MAG: TIGR02147 family protein [Bacteriovoracaceae bacterium]